MQSSKIKTSSSWIYSLLKCLHHAWSGILHSCITVSGSFGEELQFIFSDKNFIFIDLFAVKVYISWSYKNFMKSLHVFQYNSNRFSPYLQHLASFPLSPGDKVISAKERLQKAKVGSAKNLHRPKVIILVLSSKIVILEYENYYCCHNSNSSALW